MTEERELAVGGLAPFTTIDFPGKLSAVVFCQGCPWRCTYCHNPHLQPVQGDAVRPWREVASWLQTRRGLLDGVVFSGGEPLLQRNLPQALAEVRQMGFATALHTAGAYPDRLAAVLPLLDWVGFDVKAPFGGYRRITGADDGHRARESLGLLLASGLPHEVRCTVPENELEVDDMANLASQLAALGVSGIVLQGVRSTTTHAGVVSPAFIDAASIHLQEVRTRA